MPDAFDDETVPEPLSWDEIRATSSWQRGTPLDADIEEHDDTMGCATVEITRDDGGEHAVQLFESGETQFGRCDCRGFEYNDYCAHLVALHRSRRDGDEAQVGLGEVESR